MKRLPLILYIFVLFAVSIYGLAADSYYVRLFVNSEPPFIAGRMLIIAVLSAYYLLPQYRMRSTRFAFGAFGCALAGFGILTFFTPTLLGNLDNYIPFGESLILLEGGILALIMWAELPVRQTEPAAVHEKVPYYRLMPYEPQMFNSDKPAYRSVFNTDSHYSEKAWHRGLMESSVMRTFMLLTSKKVSS